MVNERNLIPAEKPKVAEVRFWDYQEVKKSPLSPAARGKVINKSGSNFSSEKEGYGPCRNDLCGCSCSSYTCNCVGSSGWAEKGGTGYATSFRGGGEGLDKEANGQVNVSIFSYRDSNGEGRFLGSTAKCEASIKEGVKVQWSADLCNVKTNGVQIRAGIGIDTGLSIKDGLEAKVAGFGFSVGKQTGISTPFGEVKVDTDDCVIQ